ncbi:MAG: hypothetical protein Q8O86_00605 [Dehalococcoidia bacterium]|nr:hypothetical protein [Dehalococcoidia bacterium]
MNLRLLISMVLLSLGLAACQPAAARNGPPSKAAPDFALVDQNGQPVRLSDLRGRKQR